MAIPQTTFNIFFKLGFILQKGRQNGLEIKFPIVSSSFLPFFSYNENTELFFQNLLLILMSLLEVDLNSKSKQTQVVKHACKTKWLALSELT